MKRGLSIAATGACIALVLPVTVDAVIPPEFYRAVAEIVHLIQSKRAAWPLSRRRLN